MTPRSSENSHFAFPAGTSAYLRDTTECGHCVVMLSDLDAKSAKPRESAYKLTDGEGLYLQVQPSGTKLWRLAYRFQNRQRTLSLGTYPTLRLKDARDRKTDAKRLLAAGVDPMEARTVVAENQFQAVAEAWHGIMKAEWVPEHADRVLARLTRDVFPVIGKRPISEIGAPEVLRMLRKVEDRGTLEIAKRLRQNVGQIFRFAIAEGKAAGDPTAALRGALKKSPRVRHMPAVDVAKLPDLVDAIVAYRGSVTTRLALKFTLLTAVRSKEMRFARWDEIDGDLWKIPGDRMKMKRPHVVPLSRQAQATLAEMKTHARGPYLVAGPRSDQPLSTNTMIGALYRMELAGVQTVHGMRRLFSTAMNEAGFNRDWVELQLAHVEENKIRGAYNAALYLPGRTAMMQAWADMIYPEPDEFDALIG